MKAHSLVLTIGCAAAIGVVSYASGQQAAKPVTNSSSKMLSVKQSVPAKDSYVGVYVTSVARQIKMSDLEKAYPSEHAGAIDRGKLAADAIVGWYDKGNSFHEQKMQNNLKVDWGATRILPNTLRGVDLRSAQDVSPR